CLEGVFGLGLEMVWPAMSALWPSPQRSRISGYGRSRRLRSAIHIALDHGHAGFDPSRQTAGQRTHRPVTKLLHLQRHPGAGRFAWSSTHQRDLLASGDLDRERFDLFRKIVERSGDGMEIVQDIKRMAEIDDPRTIGFGTVHTSPQ